MRKTVTVLGTIHIAWGVLGLLVATVLYIILIAAGVISGDYEAERITSLVASSIFFPMMVLSIPAIIGGIGMLRYRPWARMLILVLSFFHLLLVPFGTVLGIVTIKYLLEKDIIRLFEQSAGRQKEDRRLETTDSEPL